MTQNDFVEYIARVHGLKTNDPVAKAAVEIAISSYCGERPWSFLRGEDTLTSNSSGIIELPSDFDGVLSMREQESTYGGFIYCWSETKFDFDLPRPSSISGSYPKSCKVYKSDGVWYGQLAPPVASISIYLTYKVDSTQITNIPEKALLGLKAVADIFITPPESVAYANIVALKDEIIKREWKKDRRSWREIYKTIDRADVQRFMPWWGVWNW